MEFGEDLWGDISALGAGDGRDFGLEAFPSTPLRTSSKEESAFG